MKPGDLVRLKGGLWSSYNREDQLGLVLKTTKMIGRSGYSAEEFSDVRWCSDGKITLTKTKHLKVIDESNSN